MGLFDGDGGGNLSKGVIAVLGALLAGKLLSNRIDQPEPGQPAPQPRPTPPSANDDGGILGGALGGGLGGSLGGGLGGLLDKLRDAGHGTVADSWVSPGENKPIAPKDLGSALGQKTLSEIAAQAGMSEQELLEQLSHALPGVVDKLTPDGRVPSNAEVATRWGTSVPSAGSPW